MCYDTMACTARHDTRDFQKQPQHGKTPKANLEISDVHILWANQPVLKCPPICPLPSSLIRTESSFSSILLKTAKQSQGCHLQFGEDLIRGKVTFEAVLH